MKPQPLRPATHGWGFKKLKCKAIAEEGQPVGKVAESVYNTAEGLCRRLAGERLRKYAEEIR